TCCCTYRQNYAKSLSGKYERGFLQTEADEIIKQK
ncbi:hypothetical protein EVA_22296, partial [gut metagenome]